MFTNMVVYLFEWLFIIIILYSLSENIILP